MKRIIITAAIGLLVALPARANDESASAAMKNPAGEQIGTIELRQTATGVALSGEVTGIPAGEHAFHIHETGTCEGADGFKSAGDHFAMGRKHGFAVDGGPHPGDMRNVTVGADEVFKVDTTNERVSLEEGAEASVFDTDGSAIVIHAGADDYESQPSGDAGGRIACGVIEKR